MDAHFDGLPAHMAKTAIEEMGCGRVNCSPRACGRMDSLTALVTAASGGSDLRPPPGPTLADVNNSLYRAMAKC